MIQLYSPNNENYNNNGDIVLLPSEFTVSVELNGSWVATMEHPIDDEGRWKYIEDQAVIRAPSFNGEQLFRIISKTKSDSGVTASLEPIFFDSIKDCFLIDVRPIEKTGQEALDIMTAINNKYLAESDIDRRSTAYYQFKNLMEAINGDDDNSFLKRWGGEILFDNFKIIINERVGGDYGVELRYGKNISENGIAEDVDMAGVITRIYPKAYNGYTITDNGYVDSDLVNNYPMVKIGTMTFDDVKMREDASEDDEESGVIVCDTQEELDIALTKKCKEQFSAGIDKPKVTISAQMILLQNTEQYKDYAVLEEVSLGDTIHCINNHLGIVTDARVIALTYDSILKKVDSVTVGDYEHNYFNDVTSSVNRVESAIRPDGTVIGQQIAGFIDGALTQLRLQNTLAKKQNVRAILFEDLDINSPTFGAMALGTQGLQISRNRTADGRDWLWTTAMTAGGLIANIIKVGLISDKTGKSYWNLDTGEFVMTDGTITAGTITGSNLSGISIENGDSAGNKVILSGGDIEISETQGNDKSITKLTGNGIRMTRDGGSGEKIITTLWPTGTLSMNCNKPGFDEGKIQLISSIPTIVVEAGSKKSAIHPDSIVINDMPTHGIQTGTFSAKVSGPGIADTPITFERPFKNTPVMIAAFESKSDAPEFGKANVAVSDVTKTGGRIRIFNADSTGRQPDIVWVAIGE